LVKSNLFGIYYSSLQRHWPDASSPQIVEAPLLELGSRAYSIIIVGLIVR